MQLNLPTFYVVIRKIWFSNIVHFSMKFICLNIKIQNRHRVKKVLIFRFEKVVFFLTENAEKV